MQNQLRKAISLAKKTGDKIMVFDSPESDDAYVLMPFDDYEKMIEIETNTRGLTEIELIDKINRDIAIWKNDQELEEDDFVAEKKSYGPYNVSSQDKKRVTEGKHRKAGKFPEHISNVIKNKQKKSGWNIPKQRKEKATEIEE